MNEAIAVNMTVVGVDGSTCTKVQDIIDTGHKLAPLNALHLAG